MEQWQDICAVSELGSGEHSVIELQGQTVLLVNVEGAFYAVENLCTHDGGELDGGTIEGTTVICPRHSARFCLKTGQVLSPPAFEDIDAFPVRVVKGRVQINDAGR